MLPPVPASPSSRVWFTARGRWKATGSRFAMFPAICLPCRLGWRGAKVRRCQGPRKTSSVRHNRRSRPADPGAALRGIEPLRAALVRYVGNGRVVQTDAPRGIFSDRKYRCDGLYIGFSDIILPRFVIAMPWLLALRFPQVRKIGVAAFERENPRELFDEIDETDGHIGTGPAVGRGPGCSPDDLGWLG